jgi:hypothetical protein
VDASVPVLDSGNIDNIKFSHTDNVNLNFFPELNNTLSQSFDIVKEKADVGILNNTSAGSSIVNSSFIPDTVNSFDHTYGKDNFVNGNFINSFDNTYGADHFVQGLFDIFSVNRKDSLFQLLANVHLDKHVNWVGDCTND